MDSPNNEITFKLLYRATRDGDSYEAFHSKCNEAPNITFIKINDGNIIGGYTTIPWKSEKNSYIPDKEAFIFSINFKEKHNLKKELNGKNAIYHNISDYCCCYGYCGDDLAIHEKFLNNNNSYCCGNGNYISFDTNNLKMLGKDINGKVNITVSELEVYKIYSDEIDFYKDCSIIKSEKKTENINSINNQGIIDSMIIKNENIAKMLKNWINPNNDINFELLYKATRDGDSINDFHLKCGNNSPTICIIIRDSGEMIGGYTTIPWINEDKAFISDENAFFFSVDSKEKYNLKKN